MSEHEKRIMEIGRTNACENNHDQSVSDKEHTERIMEIGPNIAKRKRGKPNVYVRHFGFEFGENLRKGYESVWYEYKPKSRSIANLFYILKGNSFVREHLAPELYQFAFMRDRNDKLRNRVVLEQIGRALLQDHLSDEDCQKLTLRAIDRLRDGYHSTWVAKYLRGMRNDLASQLQRDL